MLRFLARGAGFALIATALGILFRCLSRRTGGFTGRGRIKASWIASTFGIDLRNVKTARRVLTTLGWIRPEPSDQNAENLWGRAYRIDLGWGSPPPCRPRSRPHRPNAPARHRHPSRARSAHHRHPLFLTRIPSGREIQTRTPSRTARLGFVPKGQGRGRPPCPHPTSTTSAPRI